MSDQIRARLTDLRQEYEIGQRRLQELVSQEVTVRETLLRISGAIQVLEELTGDPASAAETATAGSAGAAVPGADTGATVSVG